MYILFISGVVLFIYNNVRADENGWLRVPRLGHIGGMVHHIGIHHLYTHLFPLQTN